MEPTTRTTVLLLGLAFVTATWEAAYGSDAASRKSVPPYQDDTDIVGKIAALGSRSALTLPPFKVDAKSNIYGCQSVGPVTRGYTMRMVYAPERQTALYHGGDHQTLRSNDVWEYHLGSNTWHMIFEPDGGNQGPLKGVLMFLARKLRDNPDYRMTTQEQKEYEEVRDWWMANVVLKDGYLVTSHGGPILPGHTWDTLVYEPQTRLLIHGTGAYCSDAAVLHGRYHNLPLADVALLPDVVVGCAQEPVDRTAVQWRQGHQRACSEGSSCARGGATDGLQPDAQADGRRDWLRDLRLRRGQERVGTAQPRSSHRGPRCQDHLRVRQPRGCIATGEDDCCGNARTISNASAACRSAEKPYPLAVGPP